MTPNEYQTFTTTLTATLAANGRILGLVALGSMAQQDYQPDRWSDHDFFVVTQPGAQPALRADLGWLPDAARIALAFQETAHGMKVIYDSGHLLEFAVFDPDELQLARVNRYRVLLDKADVTARMAAVAAATAESAPPHDADPAYDLGQFLTALLVGCGRFRRGERLSAHEFVKGYAVNHLLKLTAAHVPSANQAILDNLNPTRRFELAYPEIAAALHAALLQDTETAARTLLALAQHHLAPIWPAHLQPATDTVSRFLHTTDDV